MLDQLGRTVLEATQLNGELDITNLVAGTYFLVLEGEGGKQQQLVVKQ